MVRLLGCRKLVLTKNRTIDTGMALFVACSFRIVASSMILQSSVDPLLAVEALVCGVVVPSAVKGFVIYVHKLSFRKKKDKHRRSYKPVVVENEHRIRRLSDSNTFYSSFHDAPERKHYSKDEWEEFRKESTKKALESLVCSPDFSRWAVAHADTITLLPKKQRRHSWFPWSS